ncbi:hypothetical protein MMC11_000547 [Xylographa trunciseda]|nr:hypothetical protein [Xylographa trunciseda]
MFKFPKLNKVTSIHHVLVADDEDETTFTITHPKHLTWFASPLVDERAAARHNHEHAEAFLKQPRHGVHETQGSNTPENEKEHTEQYEDPEEPVLKRAHESSTIQLFYDLFFVANLTTFTALHEIDDAETLKSYIAFFAILWFTWFQVALFDVRFSNDSAFERLSKALQFGIMTGFAIVGPNFQLGAEDGTAEGKATFQAYQTLSLILMASRLILACQYAAAYVWLANFKKAHVPLLAHIGTLFVAAMIYLGLFFSFRNNIGETGLIAWYVTIGFETIVILLVSGRTKFLSFRKTAIVERLGLLTLIILGEGIIGLCNSVSKVGSDGVFTSDIIGMIISSVAIIYFIWMLYFDQEETNHVGTLRQMAWTVLHFPFHITVLLVVEGLNRLSVWVKLLDTLNPLAAVFINVDNMLANSTIPVAEDFLKESIASLNETINQLFDKFELLGLPSDNIDVNYYLNDMLNNTSNVTAISEDLDQVLGIGFQYVCDNLGVEAPKEADVTTPGDQINAIFDLFSTVYIYFFTAAGLCLILLAVLFWLGKRRKLRGEILSIGVRIAVGVGLSLLALMDLPSLYADENSAISTYLYTPWLLPTVVICYGIVVLVDNLLINYVRKAVAKKRMRSDHVTLIDNVANDDPTQLSNKLSYNHGHHNPNLPLPLLPCIPKLTARSTIAVVAAPPTPPPSKASSPTASGNATAHHAYRQSTSRPRTADVTTGAGVSPLLFRNSSRKSSLVRANADPQRPPPVYTCQKPQPSRCGFFLWDDEARPREAGAVLLNARSEAVAAAQRASPEQVRAPSTTPSKQAPRMAAPTTPSRAPAPSISPEEEFYDWASSDDDKNTPQKHMPPPPASPPRKALKADALSTPAKRTHAEMALLTPSTGARMHTAAADDDVFTTPTTAPHGRSLFSTAGLPSPVTTPTPQRFRSFGAGAEGSALEGEILDALRESGVVTLGAEAQLALRGVCERWELRLRGVEMGREVVRAAVRRKEERIGDLLGTVEGLEREREAGRALVRSLRGGREGEGDVG